MPPGLAHRHNREYRKPWQYLEGAGQDLVSLLATKLRPLIQDSSNLLQVDGELLQYYSEAASVALREALREYGNSDAQPQKAPCDPPSRKWSWR